MCISLVLNYMMRERHAPMIEPGGIVCKSSVPEYPSDDIDDKIIKVLDPGR